MALRLARILDPREESSAAEDPYAEAVNVPAAELPTRVHELPKEGEVVSVAIGPGFEQAERALIDLGRRPVPEAPIRGHAPGRWRLWRPSPFLEEVSGQIETGTAVDIGCGVGRDAVFLGAAGFHVIGVDVLPDAIARAKDLARRYAPDAQLQFQLDDAEADSFGVDTPARLVIAMRFLHRPLFARIGDLLMTGGCVVIETFTERNLERNDKPKSRNHLLAEGELLEFAGAFDVIHYSEEWRDGVHTARLFARRR